jgi:hypothetical protein
MVTKQTSMPIFLHISQILYIYLFIFSSALLFFAQSKGKLITTKSVYLIHLSIPCSNIFSYLVFLSSSITSLTMLQYPQKIDMLDRTVGVDISTMKIGGGEASVWDFGGQLEYAVTHQFLLSTEVQLIMRAANCFFMLF